MSTVADAFDDFDRNLNLEQVEREAAIELHHKIRDILKEAGVCSNAILQGSFARKTMLPPIKDVDMIGFLNVEHAHLRDEPGGVARAMALIEDAISAEIPDVAFERSRHAVQITIPGYDFTFDLVPAFDRPNSKLVDIANLDHDTWDESNARELNDAVAARNQNCGGMFIHQVRMVREYVRGHLDGIKGLDAESATYHAITEQESHPAAVAASLAYLANALENHSLLDPTDVDDLFERRDIADITFAAPLARYAADQAQEALALEADDDHRAAISIWRDILGENFPEPEQQTVTDAFRNSVGGSVTSSGYVSRSSRGRTESRGGRAWRSR